MAYKNIEDSRAAIRRHYYANKEKYLEKSRKRRTELQLYVRNLKSVVPCKDCGIAYPYYVMDFDHVEDKVGIISQMIKANNLKKLKDEIEKCEVVCANCHRIRTFNRQHKSL